MRGEFEAFGHRIEVERDLAEAERVDRMIEQELDLGMIDLAVELDLERAIGRLRARAWNWKVPSRRLMPDPVMRIAGRSAPCSRNA